MHYVTVPPPVLLGAQEDLNRISLTEAGWIPHVGGYPSPFRARQVR